MKNNEFHNYSKNAVYLCPTVKRHVCSWEGPSEDIFQHFLQEHESLLHSENSINIDIHEESENRLLFYNEEIYLVQTKISDDKLFIFLRYLGPTCLAQKISYRIEIRSANGGDKIENVGCENGAFVVTLKDVMNDDIVNCIFDITFTETSHNEEKLDNSVINEELEKQDNLSDDDKTDEKEAEDTFSEEYVPSNFYTTDKPLQRTHSLDVDGRRLAVLKRHFTFNVHKSNDTSLICSNCKLKLLPPVYLCEGEHNICSECLKNPSCEICHKKMTKKRNSPLEDKCRNHLYPCKYEDHGCTKLCSYKDILFHELNCIYCDYICGIDNCPFTGQLLRIKEHFKIIHSGSIKLYEVHIVKFPKNSKIFLVHENGVFYCESFENADSGITWEVRFCGPKERKYSINMLFFPDKSKGEKMMKKVGDKYQLKMSWDDIKKMKVKNKVPTLNIGYTY